MSCPSEHCRAACPPQRQATDLELRSLPDTAASEHVECCTYCSCLYTRKPGGRVVIWKL
jgi:hypothetical protein